MRFSEALFIAFGILYMIAIIGGMGLMIISSIDKLSLQEVGQEKVPCIDKQGRTFESEICIKKKTCSDWGFAGSEGKCSDLNRRTSK